MPKTDRLVRDFCENEKDCQNDHDDMSRLTEIQKVIKELRPCERTALREWLNGYEGYYAQ